MSRSAQWPERPGVVRVWSRHRCHLAWWERTGQQPLEDRERVAAVAGEIAVDAAQAGRRVVSAGCGGDDVGNGEPELRAQVVREEHRAADCRVDAVVVLQGQVDVIGTGPE